MEEQLNKVGMEIRDKYHQRLKAIALERRMKLKDVLDEILAASLDDPKPEGRLTRDEKQWVDMLLSILRSKDPHARTAVTSNLLLFERYTKLMRSVEEHGSVIEIAKGLESAKRKQ